MQGDVDNRSDSAAPTITVLPNGDRRWFTNGLLHREDGPAVEGRLGRAWYRKGKKHREDGPAVEWADGRNEWYRHGEELTEAQFAALREKELAQIGEAFKSGLNGDIKVFRAKPPKTASQRPPD